MFAGQEANHSSEVAMSEVEPRAHELAAEFDAATKAVEKAMIAYREGKASCAEVNRANDRLADLHLRSREISGGRIRDFRY
jgi:hypothetical protein